MWGSRQCSSGREDWPGRQSQGRCSPGEGSGSKLRDYKGGKISWWGKLKFLITLKPPVLIGPLFRVVGGCSQNNVGGISSETRHT